MTENLTVVVRVLGAIFFGFLGLYSGLALAEGDSGLTRVLFLAATPTGFILFGTLATPFIIIAPLHCLYRLYMVPVPALSFPGTYSVSLRIACRTRDRRGCVALLCPEPCHVQP